MSYGYGYGYFGGDDDDDNDLVGETEFETLKNLADRIQGTFAPKVGETKAGGDIKVGLFPGGQIFVPGTENAPKVAGGLKLEFSTADEGSGSGFRPTRMPVSPYIPRVPVAASSVSAKAGWGRPRFRGGSGRRFKPSPYIPRMPGRGVGMRVGLATQSRGPIIKPDPLPPITDPGPPKPINIPDIPIPPDPPKDGWGRAALPPVRMGMRTMIPSGPPPGATVFDPRQEMIEAAQMSRMGPTPFGPGATIYRPETPMVKDPPDKFLSGYGAFTDVGKMGFAGKAAIGIGIGVTLVTLLNLGAKR